MVKILLRGREFPIDVELTLAQAYKRLGLQPESHLAVREGEIITEDRVLKHGDVIKIVPVISGGNR